MKTTNLLSSFFVNSLILGIVLLSIPSCTEDVTTVEKYSYTPDEFKVLSASLDLPQGTFEYENPPMPAHLASQSGFFAHDSGNAGRNKVTNHGATLGRVLFYDKRLSKNEKVSCSSCHFQEKAFSDPVPFSTGFGGELTPRNTLALASGIIKMDYGSTTTRGFFWDERAHSVVEQSTMTIQDLIEMGMNLNEIPDRLKNEDYYQILFKKAFGDSEITVDRILDALSQFVNSITADNSRFDQAMVADGRRRVPFPNSSNTFSEFTPAENRGFLTYMRHCSSCHGDNVTIFRETANNGLDEVYADKGVGKISGNDFDDGVFKVPSLRNVALTAPYMHDGRFNTLEEVVEHYSSGIKDHPNLDFLLRNIDDTPRKMNFSAQQKADLVAYLNTLSDTDFIVEEKYSNPMK